MVLKRDLVLAIGSYIILMVIAVKFSLMDGLGQDESAHLATSGWMYVRRIIMILFACVLPLLCGQKGHCLLWLAYYPPLAADCSAGRNFYRLRQSGRL